MTPAPTPNPSVSRQQLIVLWVLWLAFLQGVAFYWFFLGRPTPVKAAPPDALPWVAALFPVLLSGIARWQILPRMRSYTNALVVMITGIALAEATCFLGIFLAPSHRDLLCIAAALGVAQFAPVWAANLRGDGAGAVPADPSDPLSPR